MTINKNKRRFRNLVKLLAPPIITQWRSRVAIPANIPDPELYQPVYSPWLGDGKFGNLRDAAGDRTLVSPDRLWVLYCLSRQALKLPGDFVECGVYKGGTARFFADLLVDEGAAHDRHLFLFDTFRGMPDTDITVDQHRAGDFDDTSLAAVQQFVGVRDFIKWHPGLIPESFSGVDLGRIAFLHIDLDIHKSILDTLNHLYSSIVPGGVIVFDDYGFASCYGARKAVDEFFSSRAEMPLSLPTGQALVLKLP
jgi:O-methyltransferase